MSAIHSSIVYVHIVAGAFALLLFWVPAIARKGGRLHVSAGRFYVWAMYTVAVSAFVAAAMALGAQGVWTGSIWLTTVEHQAYHHAIAVEKLLAAGSGDTVRSRALSGKPARQLRTAWTEAWDKDPNCPGTLPIPLQWMVQAEAIERIAFHNNRALMGSPVGQIVGRMNALKPTSEVVAEMVAEYRAVVDRLQGWSRP